MEQVNEILSRIINSIDESTKEHLDSGLITKKLVKTLSTKLFKEEYDANIEFIFVIVKANEEEHEFWRQEQDNFLTYMKKHIGKPLESIEIILELQFFRPIIQLNLNFKQGNDNVEESTDGV